MCLDYWRFSNWKSLFRTFFQYTDFAHVAKAQHMSSDGTIFQNIWFYKRMQLPEQSLKKKKKLQFRVKIWGGGKSTFQWLVASDNGFVAVLVSRLYK